MKLLYHFTCAHSARKIGRYGILLPVPQIQIDGTPLVWLTDDPTLPREALGLTSHTIKCDRMEFCYLVDQVQLCTRFSDWVERRFILGVADPRVMRIINETKRPEHWFISESSLKAHQIRRAA